MGRTAGSTAEGTRQRILDAATELFEQRGFAGTSIRDLAVRVGMTKAALYYHFPSKEEVLQALLTPFLDDIDRVIAATAAGQWTRAELVRRLITQMNERGEFLNSVLSDPSVKHAMFERLGMANRVASLLRVLAGSDDPVALLRGRCAMGALMAGLLHHEHDDSDVRPRHLLLSPDEQNVICSAVLAVLEGNTTRTEPPVVV
ncbi:TetR/AcrR family transcriptional regulator [Cryptosporangium aurantiacum]|uniref:Transcriptional regulator, TetR family n=1 Tax=Cryptosporangium aurantiacum TaxID=134849 RepID=A0A1M7MYU1_9ACTN|nr:TetR/AcrR family transcriptional regulator [Cryptosporangium aurantiacum]SHM96360.1 transcriptional regulator, TetR family [Cryptosporangium aurantiacum]